MKRQSHTITKMFLVKQLNGTKKLVKLKYDRADLQKPIYLMRSE